MIAAHLDKLRLRADISPAEEREIRGLVSQTVRVREDVTIVRAGDRLQQSLLLLDGWMFRCKDMPNGDRQVLEVHVAGDFADLHGYTLKRLDHDIVTVSQCTIGIVPHERISRMVDAFPRLVRLYWLFTNIDASISREMALSLARRSAISRMAHLFCELYVRLGIVGKTYANSFDFPLTQRELSECLGLTVVHVNRMLQELRRRSLVETDRRRVTILDQRALESLAEFDPAYLHLEKRKLA